MIASELLSVGISDCLIANDPGAVLVTHALGSCIGVCIYDPVARVAGLLHFMLPDSTMDSEKAAAKPFMFADTGIPLLFRGAYEMGAVKQRIVTVVVGGAQLFDSNDTFNIGKRNYLSLRKIFWKAGVMIQHEDIGGTLPRTVRIEVATGRVIVCQRGLEKQVSPQTSEEKRRSSCL